tara:strand:- start:3169 stop:3930 length:762 start_codon:yes stop_codon:yes gene_type:complete
MTQWGKKNVVEFYANNRNKLSDLYPSEKKPLSYIKKKKVKFILDYGCAVGGFYNIFKSYFKKNFFYHGLDTENNVIVEAKKKFKLNKSVKFTKITKGKIKDKNNKYSLSFCTGVLNHNSNYKSIISELIRVSSNYTFIDSPRVHVGKSFIGKLNLSNRFPSEIKKNNIVNNYTVNLKNYLIFLKKLFKKRGVKRAYFFHGNLPYKKKYLKINKKISFLTFMCEKKTINEKLKIVINTKNKEVKKLFNSIFDND